MLGASTQSGVVPLAVAKWNQQFDYMAHHLRWTVAPAAGMPWVIGQRPDQQVSAWFRFSDGGSSFDSAAGQRSGKQSNYS